MLLCLAFITARFTGECPGRANLGINPFKFVALALPFGAQTGEEILAVTHHGIALNLRLPRLRAAG